MDTLKKINKISKVNIIINSFLLSFFIIWLVFFIFWINNQEESKNELIVFIVFLFLSYILYMINFVLSATIGKIISYENMIRWSWYVASVFLLNVFFISFFVSIINYFLSKKDLIDLKNKEEQIAIIKKIENK